MNYQKFLDRIAVTQKVLREERNIARNRLFHHLQSLSPTVPERWAVDVVSHSCVFVEFIKNIDMPHSSSVKMLLEQLTQMLDESLLQSEKWYFVPSANVSSFHSDLLTIPRAYSIFWASRDGYCNAYVCNGGSHWQELPSKRKTLWETNNTLEEVIDLGAKYFDCTTEELCKVLTIYHCEELTTDTIYKHILTDNLKLHINPSDGTHFDLHWNFLDVYIPIGATSFITRRFPSLGLGVHLEKISGIQSDNLLKTMLSANNDGTANQCGAMTAPPLRIEELRLALAEYFSELQLLFPPHPLFKLDGWFNAQHFRMVLEQEGYAVALPPRANVITPWHRILLEGPILNERITEG